MRMFFVIFGNGTVDQVLGLHKGVAFLDPKPIGLKRTNDPLDVGILFRAVVAGPFRGDFEGSQGILKSAARGLASVIEPQGQSLAPDAFGKFGQDRHIKGFKPFLGPAPGGEMKADDTAQEDIQDDHQEYPGAVGEDKLSHIHGPDLVWPGRFLSGTLIPMRPFFDPRTQQAFFSKQAGRAFPADGHL